MSIKIVASAVTLASMLATPVSAGCEVDISDYVGWTVIYSGTVTGYINDDGEEENGFRGCKYGRTLIVDYRKKVTCAEYNYAYAYRPDIVVISDGYRHEACIDNEMYDIRK